MKTTHGCTGTKIYRTWVSMLHRCRNVNSPKYKFYGGRGVKVCDRWLSFENFLADMGHPESHLTLDRINNDGNYEPGNCRWATTKEQNRNRSISRFITVRGERMNVIDACLRFGMSKNTLKDRLDRGMSDEEAVFGPVRPRGPNKVAA